jgi:N-acetylglucosamine-6-phosphate deacetylase
VWSVGAALPRHGVTAFLPTLVSPSFDVVDRASAALLAGAPDGYEGAVPLGWHVEGPFLNPARAGAHDPACLRPPDPAPVARWSPETGIRMVTLAPELPGAIDLVRSLSDRGVVVSIGHTEATGKQAVAAFDAGAEGVTHLFNAMPKDHLGPGVVAAALADPRVTVGLIPDGLHVEPDRVALVLQRVGPERLAIVTDAIAALGMPPGRHRLANLDVEVDADSARLPGGVLAGSVLALDEGVRNLARFTGVTPEQALAAATSVPARLLGLPARAALAPGSVGDVTLFDIDFMPVLTIVGGRVAFDATDGARWA